MARYESFYVGSMPLHHMVSVANNESMQMLHSSGGDAAQKRGNMKFARKAWDAAAQTARQSPEASRYAPKPSGKTKMTPLNQANGVNRTEN